MVYCRPKEEGCPRHFVLTSRRKTERVEEGGSKPSMGTDDKIKTDEGQAEVGEGRTSY